MLILTTATLTDSAPLAVTLEQIQTREEGLQKVHDALLKVHTDSGVLRDDDLTEMAEEQADWTLEQKINHLNDMLDYGPDFAYEIKTF